MAVVKKPAFKLPKKLGECADLLYTTRQSRLSEQKNVTEYAAREVLLKDHIIAELPKSESSGISGKLANAKITKKDIPVVEDWEALYKYIKKTGAFELLQRRVNETAVQERWDAGKTIPGVVPFTVIGVGVTKI